MKLTEEQIWKCNQTINYEKGEVVDAVHICVAHQNVVDFARSIEREIGFAKAELWIKRINDAVLAERENTNNAYKERNQLVALLSTVFPSGKAKTAINGWDEEWHGCVYIDFPWGQASWHYHTDDGWMFEHLPPYTKQWDGHTTEAKYAAIANAIGVRGQA